MLTSDFMLTFAALNKSNNQKKKMKKLFGILAVSAFLFASCGNAASELNALADSLEKVETAIVEDTTAQVEAPVDTTAQAQVETPVAK